MKITPLGTFQHGTQISQMVFFCNCCDSRNADPHISMGVFMTCLAHAHDMFGACSNDMFKGVRLKRAILLMWTLGSESLLDCC